jgi:hypothetical protein
MQRITAGRGGVNVIVEFDDGYPIDVNDAENAISQAAQRLAAQVDTVLVVARKDKEQMRKAVPQPPQGERGPDQIAFAGTKAPAQIVGESPEEYKARTNQPNVPAAQPSKQPVDLRRNS